MTELTYCRFFTRGLKLDYPNPESSKASRKYVKGMKALKVCRILSYKMKTFANNCEGCDSNDQSFQQQIR